MLQDLEQGYREVPSLELVLLEPFDFCTLEPRHHTDIISACIEECYHLRGGFTKIACSGHHVVFLIQYTLQGVPL